MARGGRSRSRRSRRSYIEAARTVSGPVALALGPRRYLARRASKLVVPGFSTPVHRMVWSAQRWRSALSRVSGERERREGRSPSFLSRRPKHLRVGDIFALQRMVICVRRGVRRSVLFALGGAGAGKRKFRRSRYTTSSEVRC